MKKIKQEKRKGNRTLEIIALLIALLCLAMGFLALSSHFKVQSQTTAHPDRLDFKIIFSTEDDRVRTDLVEPFVSNKSIKASNGVIINSSTPKITNLGANFTSPGQKVTYKFYIYNAGEYTGYLNYIHYENLGRYNTSKICIKKDGTTNKSINDACENIKMTIKVGNVTTSKSLYYINGRSLRPRTAQPVEVTIEYLEGIEKPNEAFDVFFGDIRLHYSMFDNESTHVS